MHKITTRDEHYEYKQDSKQWQEAALKRYQESKTEFALIKQEFLEDNHLYLFTEGKGKRDFIGKMLQKILVDNNLETGDYQKLYKIYRNQTD